MRVLPIAAVLALVGISPLSAQFEALSGLMSRVDGISFHVEGGWLTNEDQIGPTEFLGVEMLRGYGVELYLRLSDPPADSLGATHWTQVELAIGYDQLSGIESRIEGLDMYGGLRSLPSFGVYVTFENPSAASPYLGLGSGLLQLQRFRAYDSDGLEYEIDSDTFELALVGGISHDTGVYAEFSYRLRRFDSLDWSFPGGNEALGPTWPRSLNFSGFLMSVGVQVNDLFS